TPCSCRTPAPCRSAWSSPPCPRPALEGDATVVPGALEGKDRRAVRAGGSGPPSSPAGRSLPRHGHPSVFFTAGGRGPRGLPPLAVFSRGFGGAFSRHTG